MPVQDYVGREGEIFYDVTENVLRISDGATAGGQLMGGGGNLGNYTFTGDNVSMPDMARFNSGGSSTYGRAEFGTDVYYNGNSITNSQYVDSEVFMGAGLGEFRSIHNKNNNVRSALTYAGVEDVQYGVFSGMISQTDNMDSMYSIDVNSHDNIILGAEQYYGSLVSKNWASGLGTVNNRGTINGIYADGAVVNVTGGSVGSSKLLLTDAGVKLSSRIDNYEGINPTPYWTNFYGNLNFASHSVYTGASLAYTSDDSLIMLGAYINTDSFSGDNLALKYDKFGNIVWRKDWTDIDNNPCGSWNNTFDIDRGDNDRIYWSSITGYGGVDYLGRMDSHGNITEIPMRINDFHILDMQYVGDGNVAVAGTQNIDGYDTPAIALINVAERNIIWNSNTWVANSYTDTNQFNSISRDAYTAQYVTMGTYSRNDGHTRPFIKLWAYDGTPHNTYDLAYGLDNGHDYTGVAAYFNNGNIYATFTDNTAGVSYVTKYDHYDITTKVWQAQIGDGNSTYVYDLAFDTYDNVYIGGVSQGFNPPTSDTDFFVWSLDSVTGNVNWQKSIGTGLDELVQIGPYGTVCRGLAVSNMGDVVSITGYVHSPGYNFVVATVQLFTDGTLSTDVDTQGFIVAEYDLGYAKGNFANYQQLTDNVSTTGITSTNADLIATTNTYSPGIQEYHIDLVSQLVISPPARQNEWLFDVNGILTLPQDGDILDSNGKSIVKDTIFPYNANVGYPITIDITKDVHVLMQTGSGYQIPDGTFDGQTAKFIADTNITDISSISVSGNFAVISSNVVQTSSINWNPFQNGGPECTYNYAIWYNGAWHAQF